MHLAVVQQLWGSLNNLNSLPYVRLDNFMFKRVIAEAPADMDWPWDQLTYWDCLSLILWLSYKHCYKLQEERKKYA